MDYNLNFDIRKADGTSFYGLSLRNAVYESTVMSLSDKISGNVYYRDASLPVTMHEYVEYNGVKFVLVNPPVMVKEGMVSDNSELKGTTKYSFTFYHPMYMLANIPFTDIAVTLSEEKYLSQNKTFFWVGNLQDYVAKLNANLQYTEWFVEISDSLYDGGQPSEKITQISDVLSFSDNSIADALKTGYDTYGTAFIIDKIGADEAQPQGSAVLKKFKIVFGNPSNEIYETDEHGEKTTTPYVFRYGRGVGLKNNSRTPKNNKIITRIAGQGSETNIPYGYPQIVWYGNQDWDYTIDNDASNPNSYPIYKGIVGGAYVKLIKHPFTRTRLMPSVYAQDVFNKVSPYLSDGSENTEYNPQGEIKDYYDAIPTEEYPYKNSINPLSPSYEIHTFEEVKPELGDARIEQATPLDDDLQPIQSWDYTMDDDGGYHPSYFRIKLPQLDFDIYACASITETMQINMRGGACIGCTFEVQVDWEDYKRNFYDENGEFSPYGTQRDYTKYPDSRSSEIEVIVSKDLDTFGTLMPNIYQYPKGNDVLGEGNGDLFVILGISLPLSYIERAQERLDSEMKAFMLENNDYYYEYPLKFDEAFLASNQGILAQVVPNTIVRFDFKGSGEESLYVQQMSINYGVAPLPQYAITLTDHIEVVLNKIGQLESDLDKLGIVLDSLRQNGLTAAQLRSLIDTYGSTRFLSKVNNDTAQGIITFLKGLLVGQNPTDSLLDGSGTIIKDGRVQATDVEVRGTLKVLDLVASQIHALDGYYYFSDTMKIARVEDTTDDSDSDSDSDSGEILTARIYFEKEYENDFLKFYTGDILLSATADLTGRTHDAASGNVVRDVALQSWMRVNTTGTTPNGELYADVSILANDGGHYYAPVAGAYVARRANDVTDTESENYRPARQNSWCISVEEGRIVYYVNQINKDTEEYNYGVVVGKLPDIEPIRNLGLVNEIGVYAKYLLAQHVISVEYAGDVQYQTIDAGEWSQEEADRQLITGEKKYFSSQERLNNVWYVTRVKVRYNDCEWLCVGNDAGREFTTNEPTINNSGQWSIISGGDRITSVENYFATTATDSIDDDSDSIDVDGEGLSLGDNTVTWYADQSQCRYDALFPYMWKKTITKTVANPAGTEIIELIGVYGETGLNCHATLDRELILFNVNANGNLHEAVSEEVGVHLWLDTEELQITSVELLDTPETGIEIAVERTGNVFVLDVSVETSVVFGLSETKEYELRVTGTSNNNGVTQTWTRLITLKMAATRDGESAVSFDVKANTDFVHVKANGTREPSAVSFSFVKRNGANSETVSITNQNATAIVDGTQVTPSTNLFAPNEYVTMQWKDGNNILAEKTVRVISDGTNGEDAMSIDLSPDSILIPVDADTMKVSGKGEVRVNFRTIIGGTVQTTDYYWLDICNIECHGTHSGYLDVVMHAQSEQYFDVIYGDPDEGLLLDMDDTDWAEVKLTFNNGMVRIVNVYPNVSGRTVIGADAFSAKMTPDTWQIPYCDPRTKNEAGNWNPSHLKAAAPFSSTLVATLGDQQQSVTISGVDITYVRTEGTGDNYIHYSIDGSELTLSLVDNVESIAVDGTSRAIVNVVCQFNGKFHSCQINVQPYKVETPVSYSLETNRDEIHRSFYGGSTSIEPNLLTWKVVRTAGEVVEELNTKALLMRYAAADTSLSYITIRNLIGSVVSEQTFTMESLSAASFNLTNYATGLQNVELQYTSVDGFVESQSLDVITDGKDGERGYPGCISRLHVNVLEAGFVYRNDSLASSDDGDSDGDSEDDGMFYVDYIAVEDPSFGTSGYDVFCVTASKGSVQIEEPSIDLTQYSAEERYAILVTSNLGFQRVNVNVSSAWFTTLFAKNAYVRMMSGAQIAMTTDNNEVTAGVANGSGGYHFWSGAEDPTEANFSVDKNGKLRATGAEIGGTIKANALYHNTFTATWEIQNVRQLNPNVDGSTYLVDVSAKEGVVLPDASVFTNIEYVFICQKRGSGQQHLSRRLRIYGYDEQIIQKPLKSTTYKAVDFGVGIIRLLSVVKDGQYSWKVLQAETIDGIDDSTTDTNYDHTIWRTDESI